jgi:hypothetical protein
MISLIGSLYKLSVLDVVGYPNGFGAVFFVSCKYPSIRQISM